MAKGRSSRHQPQPIALAGRTSRRRGNSEWTLSGGRFTIEVGAPGFTQYLRRAQVLSRGPWLSVEERGGFSFAREGYG